MFALLAGQRYPDTIGYGKRFEEIVRLWRPVLEDRVNANPRRGREDKQEKETL